MYSITNYDLNFNVVYTLKLTPGLYTYRGKAIQYAT